MGVPAILVVEDNHLVAADIAANLRELGYRVAGIAENGEDAIRLAGELKPDLVLMDIILGGRIDGVAAASEISRAEKIPIVFLTAHSDVQTIARTTASGAFGHLTKPIRKEELAASISIALARHGASKELLEQKLWLATLVSSIDEGVIAVGEDGRVIFMNPQAERITGCNLAHAYGRSVDEVYSLASHNGSTLEQPRIRVAARTGAQFSRERFVLRTAAGDEVLIEEIVSALERNGRLIGAVSMFRDMREAVRLEQAQKFETIGVLAGGVAHDFNNLLAVMIGNASLAAETMTEGSPERVFLEQVLKSGRKAADLTSQLLAYAGKGTFRKHPVSLAKAVREILDLIRSTIPSNISVLLNVPEDLPYINADLSQIQQVVMNLVINASEAIGSGRGAIEISGGMPDTGANSVYLRVRDTGPGMDPKTRSKIFDPFFTTKFTGRGLGLAAVQGIIRSHDGTIDVETAPGRGTTFTAILPASRKQSEDAVPLRLSSAPAGNETILVVDDMESIWRFVKTTLERVGYKVLVAESGYAALEIIEKERSHIDLVLLDLSMPGISGAEAWRRIRLLWPDLLLCAMSGHSEQTAESQLCEEGVEQVFLQKPFTPEELAVKVRKVLDRRARPAEITDTMRRGTRPAVQ